MSLLLNVVKTRLHKQNKNWLAAILGDTGSGKSYSGLTLCKLIDPDFNAKKIAFDAESFMEILNGGELKRGSAVLFDEAGVGMAARDWYSIQNKLLGYVLQTFRRDNLAVIFTLPHISFLDVQARRLFHTMIRTMSIDYTKRYVESRFYMTSNNPLMEKDFRYMMKVYAGGQAKKVNRYMIPCPPKDLIKEYEELKKNFADKLKGDVLRILKNVNDKEKNQGKCRHSWYHSKKKMTWSCRKCGMVLTKPPDGWGA